MAAGAPNSKADHSRLFDILTNPWLAGFGSVAGILALLTGIYFFSLSQKYRGLAFYVQPVQGIVVRGAVYSGPKSPGLRVFYRNEEVATDVSTAQIAIWNQGTEAILPDDFLEPVRIVTRPAAKIFEVHVSKVSRSVIKFTADVTHLEHGEVPVSWRILEQGDGALVQLVYGGPSNVDVSLEGAILGQPKPTAVRFPSKLRSITEQITEEYSSTRRFAFISLAYLLFPLAAITLDLLTGPPYITRSARRRLIFVLLIIMSILPPAYAWYRYYFMTVLPPFGF